MKQKFMQFRKYMKSGFPQYGKSAGKQKHFKCMGFLNILGEAVNPYNPFNTGNVNSHKREKYMKKHLKVVGFSNIFG